MTPRGESDCFCNTYGGPYVSQLFPEVVYDRYSIRGKLKLGTLNVVHILSCEIHSCGHKLPSGAHQTSDARKSFNDWGEFRKFVPILGGDGTKIAPPRDIFDQTPGKMS